MIQTLNFFPAIVVALAFIMSLTTRPAQAESVYKYDISFLGSANDRFMASTVRSKMGNSILDDTNAAFWRVSEEAFIALGITNNGRHLRSLEEIGNTFSGASEIFDSIYNAVEDTDCPEGVISSAKSSCLKFTYTLAPLSNGPLSAPDVMLSYRTNVESSIRDGEFYNTLIEINPETPMVGFGLVDGIPYTSPDIPMSTSENAENNPIGVMEESEDESKESKSGGIGVGGIIGIAVTGGLILIAVMYAIIRELSIKEKAKKAVDPCEDLKEKARSKGVEDNKAGAETAV
mmetsp:Transcript_29981/g.63103  ORF Transcript_29981/g.63103 Transcript_29981/m.63103 type:complete len:289 (-) Transcript_29981:148-1014(-)